MIEALSLSKNFGVVVAARDVSFVVERGEAVGFLGPNGAGKTTTFRMMAGTLSPDSGRVRIMGHDLHRQPIEAKRKLGYMPENAGLYPEMTVDEYLLYRAELKGLPAGERPHALSDCREKAGIEEVRGVAIGHLSKGYRQRTALADALLGNPPVLLLDEPTAGLDPNQVLAFRRLIRRLAGDHALILSTHILSEVEATCSRAVVIDRGQVVASGTLDELKRRRQDEDAELEVRGRHSDIQAVLDRHPALRIDWAPASTVGPSQDSAPSEPAQCSRLRLCTPTDEQLEHFVASCVAAQLGVRHVARLRAPLDAVFARLTRGEPESMTDQASAKESTASSQHSQRGKPATVRKLDSRDEVNE